MIEWTRGHWLLGTLASAGAVACNVAGALAAEAPQRSINDPEVILRALIRALLAFDDARFPDVSVPEIVQRMNVVANLLSNPNYRNGLATFDAIAPAGTPVGSFVDLPLAKAREIVEAWLTSPIALCRAFVVTTKSVAMIALYSLPASWEAIGYAGPFDKRFDSSSP